LADNVNVPPAGTSVVRLRAMVEMTGGVLVAGVPPYMPRTA
jgi:hypothetical protein